MVHVFVDESERGPYAIGATFLQPSTLVRVRRTLREMLGPRERSIHFNNERPARRKALLAAWCELGDVRTRIYEAAGRPKEARDACLRQLLADNAEAGIIRLVLEGREGRDHHDRQTIVNCRYRLPRLKAMTYEHMRAYEDPLLWIPDGILWAHCAGGEWRRRANTLIESVTFVQP